MGPPLQSPPDLGTRAARLGERYRALRARSLALAEPLSEEDCVVQSMPEASPVKWHLAHTTWFFETFVLGAGDPRYRPFHPRFGYLFNSYYEAVGERHARPQRGLLTRPSLAEVRAYRAHVDRALEGALLRLSPELLGVFELGLNHEEQHQELILTDLKHLLSQNPLEPAYRAPEPARAAAAAAAPLSFFEYEGGVRAVGHDPERGFAFDNEGPRHRVLLAPYELGSRPSTNAEYAEFVEAGGYREPRWWLSDGWDWVRRMAIEAPLYWRREGSAWSTFTLAGRLPLAPDEPVVHVSYYEADAYARYRGARLPTEEEWESAAAELPVAGRFAGEGRFHPRPSPAAHGAPAALFGDVWEWTRSPYGAYAGFRPTEGALGEYNGKFMCNQLVLRGGSCASPDGHLRATYRNFFPPDARWQFSGVRLARDPS